MIVPQSGGLWFVPCQTQPYGIRDLLQDVSIVLGILVAIHTLTK
jgi:hypothetical protein